MKTLTVMFIVMVLSIFCMVLIINHTIEIAKKEEIKINSKIGQRIILNNDTLLITDYSFWKNNYTLINGSEISPELINKSKTIK